MYIYYNQGLTWDDVIMTWLWCDYDVIYMYTYICMLCKVFIFYSYLCYCALVFSLFHNYTYNTTNQSLLRHFITAYIYSFSLSQSDSLSLRILYFSLPYLISSNCIFFYFLFYLFYFMSFYFILYTFLQLDAYLLNYWICNLRTWKHSRREGLCFLAKGTYLRM